MKQWLTYATILLALASTGFSAYLEYLLYWQTRRADAFQDAANRKVWAAKKVRVKRDVELLRLAADELTKEAGPRR